MGPVQCSSCRVPCLIRRCHQDGLGHVSLTSCPASLLPIWKPARRTPRRILYPSHSSNVFPSCYHRPAYLELARDQTFSHLPCLAPAHNPSPLHSISQPNVDDNTHHHHHRHPNTQHGAPANLIRSRGHGPQRRRLQRGCLPPPPLLWAQGHAPPRCSHRRASSYAVGQHVGHSRSLGCCRRWSRDGRCPGRTITRLARQRGCVAALGHKGPWWWKPAGLVDVVLLLLLLFLIFFFFLETQQMPLRIAQSAMRRRRCSRRRCARSRDAQ